MSTDHEAILAEPDQQIVNVTRFNDERTAEPERVLTDVGPHPFNGRVRYRPNEPYRSVVLEYEIAHDARRGRTRFIGLRPRRR